MRAIIYFFLILSCRKKNVNRNAREKHRVFANYLFTAGYLFTTAKKYAKITRLNSYAPVVQLDRIFASDANGSGFEPRRMHQNSGL